MQEEASALLGEVQGRSLKGNVLARTGKYGRWYTRQQQRCLGCYCGQRHRLCHFPHTKCCSQDHKENNFVLQKHPESVSVSGFFFSPGKKINLEKICMKRIFSFPALCFLLPPPPAPSTLLRPSELYQCSTFHMDRERPCNLQRQDNEQKGWLRVSDRSAPQSSRSASKRCQLRCATSAAHPEPLPPDTAVALLFKSWSFE